MSWRNCLFNHIQNSPHKDVYQFGVYTGQSMVDIAKVYHAKDVQIRTMFGFDSFEGLPPETNEADQQECWKPGEFSSKKLLGVDSVEECMSKIEKKFSIVRPKSMDLILVPGFYENTLNDDLIKKYKLEPPSYIDIDVDLYTSAKEVLTFLFKNKLVDKGTLIGYDDWGGVQGWENSAAGESRAHKEIQEEFNVDFELLAKIGFTYPHVHMLFRIASC